MLSHGFLENFIDKDDLDKVNSDLKNFLSSENNKLTYISEINKTIPSITNLINQKVLSKVKELLKNENPIICNVELHLQSKKTPIIPPHQDNFYHCINPYEGLKILIPLQPMDIKKGALTFIDCEVDFPLQNHIASNVENFSSFIPNIDIDNFNQTQTTYKYNLCDASYHFLNSIHFSQGNNSDHEIYFIVFRFQIPNAKIDKKGLNKYEECLSSHRKLIEKDN